MTGIPGSHSHYEAIEGREQRNASTQNYPSVQRHGEKEIESEQLPLRTHVSILKQAFGCCQSTVANPVNRLPLREANAL